MAGFRDEKRIPCFIALEPVAHHHRLGAGGGFVQERGVGDVESGQVRDHRLKIQERFEPALGNFGLVRCVLRIPARIFQHVALNDRRRNAIIIALADERAKNLILRRDFFQFRERVKLAARGGKIQFFVVPDFFGDRRVNQPVEAFETDVREHFGGIAFAGADVAAGKFIKMVGRIFSQSHPWKLRFGGGKARMEFGRKPVFRRKCRKHNRFGVKANPATTNGVFGPKKLQINIV